MSKAREADEVVTAAQLRAAVRSKLDSRTIRERISQLIAEYVPPEARKRHGGGRTRLPLELIPFDQRTAFLASLAKMGAMDTPNKVLVDS